MLLRLLKQAPVTLSICDSGCLLLEERPCPGKQGTSTKALTAPHFCRAGILQHPDGTVLKQLQPPPRGPRELEFYTTVSDVRCSVVLRAPQLSAVTQSEKRA